MMLYSEIVLLALVSGVLHSAVGQSFSFGTAIGASSDDTSAPHSPFSFNSQKIESPAVAAVAQEEQRRSVAAARGRSTSRSRAASRIASAVQESSRGRVRQDPIVSPIMKEDSAGARSDNTRFTSTRETLRTPTKVEQRISTQENEIVIGVSPCARGIRGQKCRRHLQQTAMACTSGTCHACQDCGSIAPTKWVSCCRDHFLCCRSLARSCQICDQPHLKSFCSVAFGKCK